MPGTFRRWQRERERARAARRARVRTPEEELERRATRWMLGLSLCLFFVPPANGLAGGAFGGYLLGSPRRALRHEIFPALGWALVGITLVGFLLTPFVGYVTLVPAGWALVTGAGLILGALCGGALAEAVHRRRAENP